MPRITLRKWLSMSFRLTPKLLPSSLYQRYRAPQSDHRRGVIILRRIQTMLFPLTLHVITVCPNQIVTFDGCNCNETDTFFRLYDKNKEISWNDDGCDRCSYRQLFHECLASRRPLTLHMGCFNDASCSANVFVSLETISPTVQPTVNDQLPYLML